MGNSAIEHLCIIIYYYYYKQICAHFKTLLTRVNPFKNLRNQYAHKIWNKTYMHKYQIQLSEELTPSILSLFKKKKKGHLRLGHAGIIDHSIWPIDAKSKKSIKRKGQKQLHKSLKCIMANIRVVRQQAAHQLSPPSSSTRRIQKDHILTKNIRIFFGEKSEEWSISRKSNRTREKNKRGDRKGNR